MIERRMDTVERRRYWKDVEVLAAQAKRLPNWMRGKDNVPKCCEDGSPCCQYIDYSRPPDDIDDWSLLYRHALGVVANCYTHGDLLGPLTPEEEKARRKFLQICELLTEGPTYQGGKL